MYKITKKDTVLFVDDEQNVLSSIKRSLIDAKFEVLTTDSPETALDILKDKEISVLVTDLKMPTVSGVDLIKIVSKHYPDTVIIVLSAYYQMSTVLSVIRAGDIFYYFTKPWKMESDFLPTIEKAIIHYKERKEQKAAVETSSKEIKKYQQELKSIRSLYNQLKTHNQYNASLLKYTLESHINSLKVINDIVNDFENYSNIEILKLLKAERDKAVKAIKSVQSSQQGQK